MSLLRFAILVLALLAGQHTATTHGYSHVWPHADAAAVAQVQAPDGDPLDAEPVFCALCVAFGGSPGAPPTVRVDAFSAAPDTPAVHFAVSPAPTFRLARAFGPRAPPSLPV
jgi:hypothetical protein